MTASNWTDKELQAAIRAYLKMQKLTFLNKKVIKSIELNNLKNGALSNRTMSSITYRMGNISMVMESIGMPCLNGYAPYSNVGKNVIERIKKIIIEEESLQTLPASNHFELELSTTALRLKFQNQAYTGTPSGNKKVKTSSTTIKSYFRDPQVKAWVLSFAKGKCEACDKKAPFNNINGLPYLEVHHVKALSNGGPDTVDNTIAICPNCHRRLHYSSDKKAFKCEMMNKINRLNPY